MFVAAPEQHRGALPMDAPRELAEQGRLADPGLAARDRDLQRPGRGFLPGGLQARERMLATLGARGPRQRRGEGELGSGRGGADASTTHLLDQRARLGARRNPQLALEPLRELVGHGQRRGPIAGRGEQADEVPVRALAERLVLDARACPREGIRALGRRGQALEHAATSAACSPRACSAQSESRPGSSSPPPSVASPPDPRASEGLSRLSRDNSTLARAARACPRSPRRPPAHARRAARPAAPAAPPARPLAAPPARRRSPRRPTRPLAASPSAGAYPATHAASSSRPAALAAANAARSTSARSSTLSRVATTGSAGANARRSS